MSSQVEQLLQSLTQSPDDEETWDAAEAQAANEDAPEAVARAYINALQATSSRELTNLLGQRATRFHDEWFSESGPLVAVLTRVLETDPDAQWAFDRLVMTFTMNAQWDDLLKLYDRFLQTAQGSARTHLLNDAAHVAKDFANQPDRAIGYLHDLLAVRPNDEQLIASMERLLERRERYEDLIALWSQRLGSLSTPHRLANRKRIAACYLEKLNRTADALVAAVSIFEDDPVSDAAAETLESITRHPDCSIETRQRALQILKEKYASWNRDEDVVSVLRRLLDEADATQSYALHQELAERLTSLGRLHDSIDHWIALLTLDPSNRNVRDQLGEIAAKINAHDRFANALLAAKDRASDPAVRFELLVEAGRVYSDLLGDSSRAIEHYRAALALDAPASERIPVALVLTRLLEQASMQFELLETLELLASLDARIDFQKEYLARAARLAAQLELSDRVIRCWQQRLAMSPTDLEALNELASYLERVERWEQLVVTLKARAEVADAKSSRRHDLVSIAKLLGTHLLDHQAAIETWRAIEAEFGQDFETIEALSALLADAHRDQELVDLLTVASEEADSPARASELLQRLGDVYFKRLSDFEKAVDCYRRALTIDSHNELAHAGLRSIAADTSDLEVLHVAAATLASVYEKHDDWQSLLSIVEPRLTAARTRSEKTKVLVEAATLAELHASDFGRAESYYATAVAIDPTDESIEHDLMRLVGQTQNYVLAAESLKSAIANADAPADGVACTPTRLSALRMRLGNLLEQRLDQPEQALAVYLPVVQKSPDDVQAVCAVIRVAGRTQRWSEASNAFIELALTARTLREDAIATLVHACTTREDWDLALSAFEQALGSIEGAPKALARELYSLLGTWHRDYRDDIGSSEIALKHAVEFDPLDAPTLTTLAQIQRRSESPELLITLLHLAEATDDNIGVLYEAARVALETLDTRERTTKVLERLVRATSAHWTTPQTLPTLPPSSTPENSLVPVRALSAESIALWAIDHLVELHVESSDYHSAISVLLEGAQLPFDEGPTSADPMPIETQTGRRLRHRAAEIAAGPAGNATYAISLYRELLADGPMDLRAIGALAGLYESVGEFKQLVALRTHELSLHPPLERRLEIRLEISNVLHRMHDVPGLLEVLSENLSEQPGHPATIEQLVAVLESVPDYERLSEILGDQAALLEVSGAHLMSAELWARTARITEQKLDDTDQALTAWKRAVALNPTAEAIDALSHIYSSQNQPQLAIEWLKKRLAMTPAAECESTFVQLATEYMKVSEVDHARQVLEEALIRVPTARDVRRMLAEFHRSHAAYAELATLLREGSAHEGDQATKLAFLREAGEVFLYRLNQPEDAIELLSQAVDTGEQLSGGRASSLRVMLAEALRRAGRSQEAHTICTQLIEWYGRRRPAERAQVHVQLALIAKEASDFSEAISQLETASTMDLSSSAILQLLASLAHEAGDLSRAERAYRALLLLLNRRASIPPPADDSVVSVKPLGSQSMVPSEVLYELHRIASEQGQPDRAHENLESAFEAAGSNLLEARRFSEILSKSGSRELVMRSFSLRLSLEHDPEERRATQIALAGAFSEHGQHEESLGVWLSILAEPPLDFSLFEQARAEADKANQLAQYSAFIDRAIQRSKDSETKVFMSLRASELAMRDDPSRAITLLRSIVAAGKGLTLATLQNVGSLAEQLGDSDLQIAVRKHLVEREDIAPAERIAHLWTLGESLLHGGQGEGLSWVERAFESSHDFAKASEVLLAANATSESTELLERVAREASDEQLLLSAMVRRLPYVAADESALEWLKEATQIAARLQSESGESFLVRRVALAEKLKDADESALAHRELAEVRRHQGQFESALEHLLAASKFSDDPQIALVAAQIAGSQLGDWRRASAILEPIVDQNPHERALWSYLLDVYRSMGERSKREALIEASLEHVSDDEDRSILELERARLLLDEPGREQDAAIALEGVFDHHPNTPGIADELIRLYDRLGRTEDLMALLRRQFTDVLAASDEAKIVDCGLRLCRRLTDAQMPEEAIEVLRATSTAAPNRPEPFAAWLELLPPDNSDERADILERLVVVAGPQNKASRAIELAQLRRSLSDVEGETRALDHAYHAEPSDEVRERLEQLLIEQQRFADLVRVIVDDARRKSAEYAVERYRLAATICRENLGDQCGEAEWLLRAWAVQSESESPDFGLLHDATTALWNSGRHDDALNSISHAIESSQNPVLLETRAKMFSLIGRDDEALTDWRRACEVGGPAHAGGLLTALEHRLRAARDAGDSELETLYAKQLWELLDQLGHHEMLVDQLASWTNNHPDDKQALWKLSDLAKQTGNFRQACTVQQRLVAIETGNEQVRAALLLVESATALGELSLAVESLEYALAQTRSDQVRGAAKKVFSDLSEHGRLARLFLEEAVAATNPNARFDALLAAGEAFVHSQGEEAMAIEPLEEALKLRPSSHEVIVALLDSLIAIGDMERALAILQPAIDRHKGRRSRELSGLCFRMARVTEQAGQGNETISWLLKAHESDMQNGLIASQLAETAFQQRQFDTALKALKAITLLRNPGPMSRALATLRQGQIAHYQGDNKRAMMLARKALVDDPSLTEAEDFIRQLGG